MNEIFVASNGVEFATKPGGDMLQWRTPQNPAWSDIGHGTTIPGLGVGSLIWVGLIEYLRQLRDVEIGRWRWPENPDYVVYAADKDNVHMVVQESTGLSLMATRTGVHVFKDLHADAARAYFAARPEPKLILLQAQDVADVWVTLNEYRPEQRAHAEHTARLLQSQDVPARVTEAEPA